VSIGGVLSGAYQYEWVSGPSTPDDLGRGAVAFQPEISITPTENDEIFFLFGFAAGNGLPGVTPFALAPWAAGLDDNAYANDEYTQFMNPALSNGPNVFLPSYDVGTALEWNSGQWSLRGVLMNIGENDDGNNFNFYGLQAGYKIDSAMGEGHYRLVVAGASKQFLDPTATTKESRAGALLSFDQQFGKRLGGFLRIGWQTDDAAVDYVAIYSGGVDIKGSTWGRSDDNIGVGYAYLAGGNTGIASTHLAEAYYRWQLGKVLGLTADIQYEKDDNIIGPDPSGFVMGLRMTAEF
jgi:hypothetical protein